MGGDDALPATGRTWLGRALLAVAVFVPSVIAVFIGVLFYMSLTEGPFVGADTEFEQPGYNASDCYWSPEADRVQDLADRLLLLVPGAQIGLMALGGIVAGRSRTSNRDHPDEGRPGGLDAMLVASSTLFLATPAAGAFHGFNIRRLLDAECVNVPVPGLTTVIAFGVLFAAASLALGASVERNSQLRRRHRAGPATGPGPIAYVSPTTGRPAAFTPDERGDAG